MYMYKLQTQHGVNALMYLDLAVLASLELVS